VTILRQPPTVPSRVFSGPGDAPVIADPQSIPGSPEGTFDSNRVATAPATPVANPRPIRVSSGVLAARRIHTVQPEYPTIARMIHLAGTVQLRAIIATDGSVRNLEVVSGNPILAKAAVDAVRQWRYQPTLLSGKPVEVETVITVQFRMNQP
jgi:protein TonB